MNEFTLLAFKCGTKSNSQPGHTTMTLCHLDRLCSDSIVQYSAAYYTALHYTTLHYTKLHYSVVTLLISTAFYSTVQYSILQYIIALNRAVPVQYSAEQYICTVNYSTDQYVQYRAESYGQCCKEQCKIYDVLFLQNSTYKYGVCKNGNCKFE